MYRGSSSLVVVGAVFVLFFLGVGIYIVQRNSTAMPVPFLSISPTLTPYLPQSSSPTPISVTKRCVVGGCSGELCVSEEQGSMASICIYKFEFACYKKARCEVQTNGVCGWTQTGELSACIANSRATPIPQPPIFCNPPVDCAAPPVGCNYQGSNTCTCGKLVCASHDTNITPTTPIPIPVPTPSFTPTPTPFPTPSPSPAIISMTIEADDNGFYPSAPVNVSAGIQVNITFKVRANTTYYGGLDFRSSKFNTGQINPGAATLVTFTADTPFTISSYWPASGVKKADLQIVVK